MSKRVLQVMVMVLALTGAFAQAAFAMDFQFTDYDVSQPEYAVAFADAGQAVGAAGLFSPAYFAHKGHKVFRVVGGLGGVADTDEGRLSVTVDVGVSSPHGLITGVVWTEPFAGWGVTPGVLVDGARVWDLMAGIGRAMAGSVTGGQ